MKTKDPTSTTGISNPSWPGLGFCVNVIIVMPVKMKHAKIGVSASARPRGAVQFTDPSNAHCIGNRASSRNRAFARTDMQINKPIAIRAMIDWITSITPTRQNISG